MKDEATTGDTPWPKGVEFPTPERLRNYGDVLFLAMRSPRHLKTPLGWLRRMVEPAVEQDQCSIFRISDMPRGLFTWAMLSPEAERDYVRTGLLDPNAWRSGDRLWAIDFIAPYKGMAQVMGRWIMKPGNFTTTSFRYRRMDDGNTTRRIVDVDFNRPGRLLKVCTDEDILEGRA